MTDRSEPVAFEASIECSECQEAPVIDGVLRNGVAEIEGITGLECAHFDAYKPAIEAGAADPSGQGQFETVEATVQLFD